MIKSKYFCDGCGKEIDFVDINKKVKLPVGYKENFEDAGNKKIKYQKNDFCDTCFIEICKKIGNFFFAEDFYDL